MTFRPYVRRLATVAVGAFLAVVVLAACSNGPADPGPPAAKRGGRVLFVSLGGDETAGSDLDFPAVVESRWTQVLYRSAFPTRAVHLNLAGDQQSIGDGERTQLQLAVEARPTVAAVWFGNGYEEAIATPVDVFQADLSTIVQGLKAAGARVFVATDTGTVYEDAIARVVADEQVTGVSVASLSDPLGVAGHAEAARRFGAAIGKVP